MFNYTATVSDELPGKLTTDQQIVQSVHNPVELNLNRNKTVVSIIVPWLGLTAIIRRHNSHLSIVIQMPAKLAAESEGLCTTDAPTHSKYDANEVANQNCNASDYGIATQACGTNFIGIVSQQTVLTYSYSCIYDILQAASYELLPLYLAIWRDLEALPSQGIHITPNPYEPTEPPSSTSSTSSTSPTTSSSTSTTNTPTIPIVTTSTVTTGLDPTLLQTKYSSAESSFKRPSILLVFSLCLCLLLTIMLS